MFGPDLCSYDVSRIHVIFTNAEGKNLLKKDEVGVQFLRLFSCRFCYYVYYVYESWLCFFASVVYTLENINISIIKSSFFHN